MKNKKKRGFANAGQPLFNDDDFMEYFESRVSEMIKNEVEQNFRDMLYKHP